jgi:hypothetical protein
VGPSTQVTGNPTNQDLGVDPLTFAELTRSKSLEVIPEEPTRYEEQPHLSGESFVVLPAVVQHPVRPKR